MSSFTFHSRDIFNFAQLTIICRQLSHYEAYFYYLLLNIIARGSWHPRTIITKPYQHLAKSSNLTSEIAQQFSQKAMDFLNEKPLKHLIQIFANLIITPNQSHDIIHMSYLYITTTSQKQRLFTQNINFRLKYLLIDFVRF